MIGFVYFMGPENGPIKIGFAKDVFSRIQEHQMSNSEELKLWGTMVGDVLFEKHLHRVFKDFRIRGEWFHRCEPILEFISENTADYVTVRKKLEAHAGFRDETIKTIKQFNLEGRLFDYLAVVRSEIEEEFFFTLRSNVSHAKEALERANRLPVNYELDEIKKCLRKILMNSLEQDWVSVRRAIQCNESLERGLRKAAKEFARLMTERAYLKEPKNMSSETENENLNQL